jgi:hypothetical protein
MSLITAIYNHLTADTELAQLLAKDPLTNAAAIYEQWAHEDAAMPYIVQTHTSRQGNHFAKVDALATFDIFTDQGSINAEAIRNRLIKLLDQLAIEVENENTARFYYARDLNIGDPELEVTHWQTAFDVAFWRKNWIEYSENPPV